MTTLNKDDSPISFFFKELLWKKNAFRDVIEIAAAWKHRKKRFWCSVNKKT